MAQHPTEAASVLSWKAITESIVTPMHMRWGGEYSGITSTPDGFVTMSLDQSANGVPQLWSRLAAPS